MAPAAGFEPATKWLTATYSTAELCRSAKNVKHKIAFLIIFSLLLKKENLKTNQSSPTFLRQGISPTKNKNTDTFYYLHIQSKIFYREIRHKSDKKHLSSEKKDVPI